VKPGTNESNAAELAEMLQFLTRWLTRGAARLAASLEGFAGNPAYGIPQLRDNLERFIFLLGGSDRRRSWACRSSS
jgi:hypothetical protein